MTDLQAACLIAHRYHLDVYGTRALLADLPREVVQALCATQSYKLKTAPHLR